MVIVRKRKESHRRGIAAVEVALVLPVLLLVTFGAIRYGWFFLKLQQITNAARYGARVAVRADASTQDVLDAIAALLGPYGAKIIEAGDAPPVAFKVKGVSSGNIGDIITPGEDPIGIGDSITVTITVLAADVDILPMGLFNFERDDWKLGASVTMPKEGF